MKELGLVANIWILTDFSEFNQVTFDYFFYSKIRKDIDRKGQKTTGSVEWAQFVPYSFSLTGLTMMRLLVP